MTCRPAWLGLLLAGCYVETPGLQVPVHVTVVPAPGPHGVEVRDHEGVTWHITEGWVGVGPVQLVPCMSTAGRILQALLPSAQAHGGLAPQATDPVRIDLLDHDATMALDVLAPAPDRYCAAEVWLAPPPGAATRSWSIHAQAAAGDQQLDLDGEGAILGVVFFDAPIVLNARAPQARVDLLLDLDQWWSALSPDQDATARHDAFEEAAPYAWQGFTP